MKTIIIIIIISVPQAEITHKRSVKDQEPQQGKKKKTTATVKAFTYIPRGLFHVSLKTKQKKKGGIITTIDSSSSFPQQAKTPM